MSIFFSTALRNARANAIISQIDAGSGPGTMKFYTEPQPAGGVSITTQLLLGTLTFSDPCGTVDNGVLTFNTLIDDTYAEANALATWVRIADSDGNFVMDLSVTNVSGAGPIKMASTQIFLGGTLHISTASLTEGNS